MAVALAAASVAAPIVGGIIGNIASKGDRQRAQNAMKDAMDIIDLVGAPPDLSAKIILEKLQQVGVLTPEMEKDINLGFSKVAQIQEDESLKDAQKQALEALKTRGQIGLGPEEKAALNQIRREVAQDEEAKRQQILQNMAQRGMAGSGAELIAQLQSSQASTQRSAEQGEQLGALASQRALEAIRSAGSLGGDIRTQDFNVARTRGEAEDAVNRFNIEQSINRQSRNIGARNLAQERNLREQQRIADENIRTENQERYRQADAKRQFWLDQLGYAKQRSGARQGAQDYYTDEAGATRQMWGNIGSGVGQGAGSIYGAQSKPSKD